MWLLGQAEGICFRLTDAVTALYSTLSIGVRTLGVDDVLALWDQVEAASDCSA